MEKSLKLSKDIKMVISDFDGVFTDGTFLLDENLNQQKSVNFIDIMGVSVLLKRGIILYFLASDKEIYFKHFVSIV